jgi:hypothetical protein
MCMESKTKKKIKQWQGVDTKSVDPFLLYFSYIKKNNYLIINCNYGKNKKSTKME